MVTTTDSTTQQGLLTAKEMAQFVLDGYIEMEEPVPDELNAEVKNDADNQPKDSRWTGLDLNAFWDRSKAVQEVHKLPQFQRVLKGLMGAEPIQNHSWLQRTSHICCSNTLVHLHFLGSVRQTRKARLRRRVTQTE